MKVRGFTLLEVLVAMAIFATGIAAIVEANLSNISVTQSLDERFVGSLVASNELTNLRLSRLWPEAAQTESSVSQGGREWYMTRRIAATRDPDVKRVDIEVFSDTDRESKAATLFGYIVRYQPPVAMPGKQDAGGDGDENANPAGDENADLAAEGVENADPDTAAQQDPNSETNSQPDSETNTGQQSQ
ncbi:MAG: type II secretion system minor pseudopilin GspI [Gammaproteobacteria bacterium]|nr:type II secretion system minor pseudopilin GspI [Gammaproteobacteria bacterium]MDH3467362.1 type II secretion system minor pseudopilin GspI [Gammaproteobacteria bacterium]